MAKDYCVYHADKPANWNCVKCGSLVCQECFPAHSQSDRPPYCTLCGGDMRHLGVRNSMPPFWSQMPKFFAYPFALNGLIFLALLAALSIGAVKLFDTQSIVILLPIFVGVSLVIRQGLRVIEFTSQGRSRPPSIGELFDGNSTTLKMLGLLFAYSLLVRMAGHFGLLGLGAMIAFSVLLPASVMLLAIRGSLRDALDPAQVFQLAASTGWSYLGLVMVLLITSQGPQQAMQLLPASTLQHLAQSSPYLLLVMFVVSTAYFNMVMGAMMGYLLFQHHEDLGIRPDEQASGIGPADNKALDMARAVILVRESRYDDALKHMAGMVSDHPNDIQVLEYHHKLLCQAGRDPERVVQYTERYLQALYDSRRKNRFTAAVDAARRVVPAYKPKSIALRVALAEEYFHQRQFKLAVELIGMLHKEAPASEDLPAALYLLARIYSEGVRDDAKALMVLDFLLQKYPNHPSTAEVTNYRKVILSLRQTAQAAG